MAKKVEIGSVVEIRTSKGLAYAQFTHYHSAPPVYGALLRILPDIYACRPQNFKALVNCAHAFSTFFPLQAAVNRKIVEVVGLEPVPVSARDFPLFRSGNPDPRTGKVTTWWLWNGERAWRVPFLSYEQWDLPIKEICNDLALIDRIEIGWTPRRDEEITQAARLKMYLIETKKSANVRHFLVFSNVTDAQHAADLARSTGNFVEGADAESSPTVVVDTCLSAGNVDATVYDLAEIARQSKGVYDRWEITPEEGMAR